MTDEEYRLKDLFDNATSEFKDALNKRNFDYCYRYIDIYSSSERLHGQFTELLLKHNINPLKYMEYVPAEFLFGSNIASFKIPSHIKNIVGAAFYRCTSLTNIEIPDSVTSLSDFVFACCTSLTSIEIPSSLMLIGSDAFYNCKNLTSVTFTNNSQLTSIGQEAF